VDWNNLGLDLVRASERGPTISGRFQAFLNTALYSTWAAFNHRADGWLSDVKARKVLGKRDWKRWKKTPVGVQQAARNYAMSVAASEVLTTIGRTVLQQRYLEEEFDEDADELYAELSARAEELVETYRSEIALAQGQTSKGKKGRRNGSEWDLSDLEHQAERVGQRVADELLLVAADDGANQENDYADTTGYAVDPWALPATTAEAPVPVWTEFPDFDPAIAAAQYPVPLEPPFMTVNPALDAGEIRLTPNWQSLSEWGIFPRASDGGPQVPLTPHWGQVTPFAMRSSDELRLTSIVGPYLEDGETLNEEFVSQASEVVDFGRSLQYGGEHSAQRRAIAEYWELGDGTAYPPGWWSQRAVDLIVAQELSLRDALKLTFATSQAVFDAGIFAWDTKYVYDSVRPFTAINQLFFGSEIDDSRGEQVAVTDPRDGWRPYQLRRNYTPPFPDIPSGHSTFSSAAASIFVELLDSNSFPAESLPFISRFSLPDGFDGDSENGNEEATLSWNYYSQAVLQAGISRLYGGIHMMDGNWQALIAGTRIGHFSLRKTEALFAGRSLDRDRTDRGLPVLVFGTMGDDLALGPAQQTRAKRKAALRAEVYGFGGDDVLTAPNGKKSQEIELFGGDGLDTFVIGRAPGVIVRDYEAGETLVVAKRDRSRQSMRQSKRYRDGLSVKVVQNAHGSVTHVRIGGKLVVRLDGEWTLSQLEGAIEIE
jgi:membrane-associated phospholipid phosphatase